ncbi:MAG: hypothetical protein QM698_00725 [Micropepsaceae bacterium]
MSLPSPVVEGRPLIVVDADEVLLRFLQGLENYLPSEGLYLDLQTYQLTGNIRRSSDGGALDQASVSALLKTFHATAGLDLSPVAGASDALAALAPHAQIVVLTNIAPELTERRRANLRAHGLDYPVIANAGLKGPAFAALAAAARAPAIFVDDIPRHHASVAEAHAGAHQIHLVADPRLFAMAKPAPQAGLFTSDWNAAHSHILKTLALI